ncbi:MAG: anti-sigma factor family protein, partial [Anaerolineae bacterium]
MHDTTKIDEQTMQGNHDDHLSSEVMSLALDGLLSPGELREFDQHLHSCVACSVRWTKWQQISRLLEVEP